MSVAVASCADAAQAALPVPVHPPAPPAAVSLLKEAQRGLAEAQYAVDPVPRFIASYLAALRAGAAVLAARGRPHRGRARPTSVWLLLESVAPELTEWAAYFAANSATQANAQAGITRRITDVSAAELLGHARRFVELASRVVFGRPAEINRDVRHCAAPPLRRKVRRR